MEVHWYTLYTRSRYEKKVDILLKQKGIETYLPLRKVLRQWSDRRKWVEEPLFRCYVFVHVNEKDRIRALETPGVVRTVSFQGKPAIVRDEEIENIRRILKEIPDVESCSPLSIGQWVKVIRGPLFGLVGRVEEIRGSYRLVIAIDSIGQALRLNIERGDIFPFSG